MVQKKIDEDLNSLVYEFNYYRSQGIELEKQLNAIQELIEENSNALSALKALPSMKEETFFPIGAGVSLKARVTDFDSVLTEVGARVYIEQSLEKAISFLEDKEKKLSKAKQELQTSLVSIMQKINSLSKRIQLIQKNDAALSETNV